MSRETDQKLADMASRLKLTRMRDNMESMLRTVTDAKMTPRETLEYFLNKEIEQRESNRIKLALIVNSAAIYTVSMKTVGRDMPTLS